ncbi:glycosyltransferase [Bacteroides sp.]|uniref:glycosyltransferase n=1 Tax=Bacteroides sp. TaxID=29523 RepID=UPI004028D1EC
MCFNDSNRTICIEIKGIQVLRIGCFMKVASQSFSLPYYYYLKRNIQSWQPDIIHFHHPNPFVAFLLLRLIPASTKLIIHWHLDITKQKYVYPLIRRNERKLLERADSIVVTSPQYKDASLPLKPFLQKVKVIANGINIHRLELQDDDEVRIKNIRKKYNNKKLIFFIGRHVEYKGLKYLIEAEKYIATDCYIVIAGQGPLTEELKAKANLERVIFVGRLNNDDLRCYLHVADVFAFPSITKNEAFGLALAEAMYCGCPAVTFHIEGSGVNWVSLNGVTGIEVANSDSKKYASAIDKLLEDDSLRKQYANAARKRVIEHFTIEKEQEAANEIYKQL